jgi:hypothetical protein
MAHSQIFTLVYRLGSSNQFAQIFNKSKQQVLLFYSHTNSSDEAQTRIVASGSPPWVNSPKFVMIAFCTGGEVAEWLNAADSKSALGSNLTEVRILSSPYF